MTYKSLILCAKISFVKPTFRHFSKLFPLENKQYSLAITSMVGILFAWNVF